MSNKQLKQRFTDIFNKNLWHSTETKSGVGSEINHTVELREQLKDLFIRYNFKTVLDIPCGDFNWMKELVKEFDVDYLGGDIVENMILSNTEKYSTDRIKFECIDLTTDLLPDADVLLCRDCMVHLSYDNINKFFTNLEKSNIKYIMMTNFDDINVENIDLGKRMWRVLNLTKEPFNLYPPIEKIKDSFKKYDNKILGLWKLSHFKHNKGVMDVNNSTTENS